MKHNLTKEKRERRHARIRAKISGTSEKPRLSVFKSNTAVYAQLIDDEAGKTIVAASSAALKKAGKKAGVLALAKEVGVELAKKAIEKKVSAVVFDRGGFVYKGKIKAIAEGAREGGLKF